MAVYPYVFCPIYKEKIWGGQALARLFDRQLSARALTGESYDLVDLSEDESVVAEGSQAGQTLAQLLQRHGREIMGGARLTSEGRFPLLVKLLDANGNLSLQVHPDKTECWYVLESRQGFLYVGLKPGVTREMFAAAIETDEKNLHTMDRFEPARSATAELVRQYAVKAGDFFFIPPGTVHLLGEGVVVAEIQTPYELVYRLADGGRGRRLDVEKGLSAVRFDAPGPAAPPGGDVLLACGHFTVRRLNRAAGQESFPGGKCRVWTIVKGHGRLNWSEGNSSLLAGQTVLVPAGLGDFALQVENEILALETTLPE
jgi:mannose-6-phosphate isomerase